MVGAGVSGSNASMEGKSRIAVPPDFDARVIEEMAQGALTGTDTIGRRAASLESIHVLGVCL